MNNLPGLAEGQRKWHKNVVREERLELSRIAPLDPKSSAYANFATLARDSHIYYKAINLTQLWPVGKRSTSLLRRQNLFLHRHAALLSSFPGRDFALCSRSELWQKNIMHRSRKRPAEMIFGGSVRAGRVLYAAYSFSFSHSFMGSEGMNTPFSVPNSLWKFPSSSLGSGDTHRSSVASELRMTRRRVG